MPPSLEILAAAPLRAPGVASEEGTFVATAAIYDRKFQSQQGAAVIERGAFVDSFARRPNPVILWQGDAAEPIGRVIMMRDSPRGLEVAGKISATQRGLDALVLMRSAVLRDIALELLNVQAHRGRDGERRIDRAELLAVSLVTWGAQADIGARVREIHSARCAALDRGGFPSEWFQEDDAGRTPMPADEVNPETRAAVQAALEAALGEAADRIRIVWLREAAERPARVSEEDGRAGLEIFIQFGEEQIVRAIAELGPELRALLGIEPASPPPFAPEFPRRRESASPDRDYWAACAAARRESAVQWLVERGLRWAEARLGLARQDPVWLSPESPSWGYALYGRVYIGRDVPLEYAGRVAVHEAAHRAGADETAAKRFEQTYIAAGDAALDLHRVRGIYML